MQNSTIEENVRLNNVIFDKNVNIAQGKVLTGDENYPVIIEKNATI